MANPLQTLRHHVTGAIERGEAVAIVEILEWAPLWEAMRARPDEWIQTTENMYWRMLEVLPPIAMMRGSFLVGEANHHGADGRAVYACFRKLGDTYSARYLSHAQFVDVMQ